MMNDFSSESFKREFESNGLTGIANKYAKCFRDGKNVPLHIAVTGSSKSGRSSFVNVLLDKHAGEEGAAEVGVTTTTTSLSSFEHPNYKNVSIWDLPGVGTSLYPQESYLNDVAFEKYDFYFILCYKRVSELDLWLAEAVKKQNKKFYFVRAHTDEDIRNAKRQRPDSFDEKEVLSKIRTDSEQHLSLRDLLSSSKVFLVDNYNRKGFEMKVLLKTFHNSVDAMKEDVLALKFVSEFTSATEMFMKEQKNNIKQQIPVLSKAIANACNDIEEKRIFKENVHCFQNQFRIDQFSLRENMNLMGLTIKDIEQLNIVLDTVDTSVGMHVTTPTKFTTEVNILEKIVDILVKYLSQERSLIYVYSNAVLHEVLNIFYNDACTLYDEKVAQEIISVNKKGRRSKYKYQEI